MKEVENENELEFWNILFTIFFGVRLTSLRVEIEQTD